MGKTTDLGDQIRVVTSDGIKTITKTNILKIEQATTNDAELALRLETVDRTDPEALYALAVWVRQQGGDDQADRLLRACIELEPDHAQARRALGHVQVEGAWYATGDALAIARGWLVAGFEQRAADLLPMILEVAAEAKHRREASGLLADVMMRSGAWNEVRLLWTESIQSTRNPRDKVRLEAYLSILDENPDGMWLLLGRDVPEGERDDEDQPSGFYALENQWVMDVALRQEARKWIASGVAAMMRSEPLAQSSRSERDKVESVLREAENAFARADTLSNGIAKAHRIELARRRIGLQRRSAEGFAAEFDREMSKLKVNRSNQAAYRAALKRMFGQLNRVEASLEGILTHTTAFPDEFDLEVQWTRLDLERIRGHRRALKAELDASR